MDIKTYGLTGKKLLAYHENVKDLKLMLRRLNTHVWRAGQKLTALRGVLDRNFQAFLKDQLGISLTQAYHFMSVYQTWPEQDEFKKVLYGGEGVDGDLSLGALFKAAADKRAEYEQADRDRAEKKASDEGKPAPKRPRAGRPRKTAVEKTEAVEAKAVEAKAVEAASNGNANGNANGKSSKFAAVYLDPLTFVVDGTESLKAKTFVSQLRDFNKIFKNTDDQKVVLFLNSLDKASNKSLGDQLSDLAAKSKSWLEVLDAEQPLQTKPAAHMAALKSGAVVDMPAQMQ